MPRNFDLDALRSLALGVELGSFAKAANCLARSTSAISAQLKKLEQQAGLPILHKSGRGLALTEAGEVLLGYARRLIALNDEAANALRGVALEGKVRVGVQEHFADALLARVLEQFVCAYPKVRIEARVARHSVLLAQAMSGEIDLAIALEDGASAPGGERIVDLPMRWIGSAQETKIWSRSSGMPLPLAVCESPCVFRSAATAALDRAGIAWRIAFTSPGVSGLWAAVEAGLGFTLLTELGLPARVKVLVIAPLCQPACRG